MSISQPRRAWVFGCGVLLALSPVTAASAQTARGWEVEVRGGLVASQASSDGVLSLPLPGPVLTTTNPQFPTRQSPSWFFGDGAAQLNGALAELGVGPRLQALDQALERPGLSGSGKGVVGFTLRRSVTPRYSAEFAVDILTGGGGLTDEFTGAVTAARDSFEPAFGGLLSTGPITGINVAASSTIDDRSVRELAITGAVEWRFAGRGALVPYLTFGGGIVTGLGDLPSATLEGRYRFNVLGLVPFDETDRIVVTFERRATPVGVLGGGVRRNLSRRVGLRVDARALIGSSGARTLIDASPSSNQGAPAGFIELFTNPALQWSNSGSTGRTSTLGGPGLQRLEVFKAQGLETRFLVSLGIFARF